MDEQEFQRLLNLFPVVRSRDYRSELDREAQSASCSVQNKEQEGRHAGDGEIGRDLQFQDTVSQDEFWAKLMLAAQKKVGPVEAERFCKAFQKIHTKLVYEGLSIDGARSFLDSAESSEKRVIAKP